MSAKLYVVSNRPAAERHVEPAEANQVPHARLASAERIMIAGVVIGFLSGVFWTSVVLGVM